MDQVADEAVGPFASWANVKQTYGAKGDGASDDTQAIQSALNDLGKVGKAQIAYFPPGTYLISSTLHLNGSPVSGPGAFGTGGVGIVGDDPSTTTIKWNGPAGSAMLIQNGGVGTHYSRLTWDGSGTAGYGVAHWWNATAGIVYENGAIHEDEVFQDLNIGIMAGRLGANFGQLDSEGQIRRVTFLRNTYAGLDLGSFNALDWWVWDSHFVDCARGVSNNFSIDDSGTTVGAGAAYVYRSLFERSTVADFDIGNTGWFSLHNNVSIGSRRFFQAAPMGSNAAVSVLESNRVVESTDPNPISLGNLGPMLLVDNQVQSGDSPYNLTDWVSGRDVLSLGNQFTTGLPTAVGTDALVNVDDTLVTAASLSTVALQLPATPQWGTHQVFEVPANASNAAIQAIIDQSAQSSDPQPIIHFGSGNWTITTALQIAAGRSMELVGDGYGSTLVWARAGQAGSIINIGSSAKVTIRDLQLLAASSTGTVANTAAISLTGADAPGGRIQIVGNALGPIQAQNLQQTQLSLQGNSSLTSMLLNDVVNAVAVSTGVVGSVTLANNSSFVMEDTWYEGPQTALFRMNDATFSYLGGHMAPASHPGTTDLSAPSIALTYYAGQASWLGMQLDLAAIPSGVGIEVTNQTAQTQAYFMGLTGNTANYFDWVNNGVAGASISFMLNETVQSTVSVQAANQGTTSPSAMRAAWSQVRSLSWDSSPYQPPNGSTDIRIYHVKMDQTGGLEISGN